MQLRFSFAALFCALLALVGCGKKDSEGGGGDTTEYTLNVRTPGEGSSLRGTLKIDMALTIDVKDKDGRSIPEAKGRDIKKEVAYRETIETFPDGVKRPTKSRVTIDKWEKSKDAFGAAKGGGFGKIVGREIVIEKRNGFYDFRPADNGGLDPGARLFLDKRYQDYFESFNVQDFLPGKPVRLYSSWDLPVKRLVKALGEAAMVPFDEGKSKGSGKLTRVWDKDGRKYGRIELTAEIVMKSPEKGIELKEGKVQLGWVVELCIDGSKHDVSATATVDSSIEFTSPKEGSGKVKVKGTMTITEVEEKIGKAAHPPAPKTETKKPGKGDGFPVEGDATHGAVKEDFTETKAAPSFPKETVGKKTSAPVEKVPDDFGKGDPSPKGMK